MGATLSYKQLDQIAVADFATSPTPSIGSGVVAWSTTTGTPVMWNGTFWRVLRVGPMKTTPITSQVVASNTASDTTITSITVAANAFAVGTTLQFDVLGSMDNSTTADTLNFWVKIGSTKYANIAFATPTTAHSALVYRVTFFLTIRVLGNAINGQFQIEGVGAIPGLGTPNASAEQFVSAFDTTVSETLILGMNWTAAVSGNISRANIARIVQVD